MRTLGDYAPANSVKDWDLLSTFFEGVDKIRKEAEALYHTRHTEIGLSHQPFLYALARLWPEEPLVAVETGVRTGISTFYLLSALRHRGPESALYSCDPMHQHPGQAKDLIQSAITAPNELFDPWVFVGAKSVEALPKIHRDAAVWDLFIHDSDHREGPMVFELEFAWTVLRPGGFLVVDDYDGAAYVIGDPTRHTGFHEFVKRNQLDWGLIGGAALLQKPDDRLLKVADTLSKSTSFPPVEA